MKTAVVLFNLGGPDSLTAVRPFLFNLFHDPAIIRLPQPFRYLLARLISGKREKVAQAIYEALGGRSPLLDMTKLQAMALQEKLLPQGDYRVFVCMRYWHPMTEVVTREVKAWQPDQVLLLPLYPQYSTTTTASSFKLWQETAAKIGLNAPTRKICCYPTEADFIAAHAKLVKESFDKAVEKGKPRILFSAHGLPEKIIKAGDPYQWQVEQTAAAILNKMGMESADHVVCYQSRVGRLKWIGPSTEHEIARACKDQVPIVLVPIAFVSEHSETLVELDIEYRLLAEQLGQAHYFRVPALGVTEGYIKMLESFCLRKVSEKACSSSTGKRICPAQFSACPSAA